MRDTIIATIIEWLGAAYDEHIAEVSPYNPDYYGRAQVEELADKILERMQVVT